jgi:hypothetical protein
MNLELKIVSHIKKNIANEQEEKDLYDLPEESRLWSIDQAANNFPELLNQMQYR